MKLTTFLVSRTKQIHAKTISVFESTFKIKVISVLTLSEILLVSAVICKQRILHENEIVQDLQNYNYEDVNQGHFRKPSETSADAMKNNYPKTIFSWAVQFLPTLYVNC